MNPASGEARSDNVVQNFLRGLSCWKNCRDVSRIAQLFLHFMHIVCSQFMVLWRSIKAGKVGGISQFHPDHWIMQNGCAREVQYTLQPEFEGLEGRSALFMCASFMERINRMSVQEIVRGIKYRMWVLIEHVNLPESHPGYSLSCLLKAFLGGMQWGSYSYPELQRLFPHAAKDSYDDYKVTLSVGDGFKCLQYLPDFIHSIFYLNGPILGEECVWLSIGNDPYDRVFKLVCSPVDPAEHLYGMCRGTFDAYEKKKDGTNRGDFMESLLSYVLPELNDWPTMLMLYTLVMRLTDYEGPRFVDQVMRNLKEVSTASLPLRTVSNPGDLKRRTTYKEEVEYWEGSLRFSVLHLYQAGSMTSGHSWWLRWLWKGFHALGDDALTAATLPTLNAGKVDVRRNESRKKKQRDRKKTQRLSACLVNEKSGRVVLRSNRH